MLEASLLREINEFNECISKNKKPLPYPVKKSLDRWFKNIDKRVTKPLPSIIQKWRNSWVKQINIEKYQRAETKQSKTVFLAPS
jgi:transposase-like protein